MTPARTPPPKSSAASRERRVDWPATPQRGGTVDAPLHDNHQAMEDGIGRWYAVARVPEIAPRAVRRAPALPEWLRDGGRR
jgi:hypothetical protein